MTGAGRLDWSTLISLSSKRADTFVPAPLDDRVCFTVWGLTKRVRRAYIFQSIFAGISVEDGLLDLVVLREKLSQTLLTHDIEHSIRPSDDLFDHWQARQICIESDPPQPVHIDGEMIGTTPVTIDILPRAIRVLVPRRGQQGENAG